MRPVGTIGELAGKRRSNPFRVLRAAFRTLDFLFIPAEPQKILEFSTALLTFVFVNRHFFTYLHPLALAYNRWQITDATFIAHKDKTVVRRKA